MGKQNKGNVDGVFAASMFVGSLLVAGSVALFSPEYKSIYTNSKKVSSVSMRDINNDGLEDIVVEQNSGDKTIYYNTGNGYSTAEEIKNMEIRKIEEGYQKQLKETNEFYRKAYGDSNSVGGGK